MESYGLDSFLSETREWSRNWPRVWLLNRSYNTSSLSSMTTTKEMQKALHCSFPNSTLAFMTKHIILCVDDEIDNVDALERLFRRKFTVLKATSGKEALALLDQNPGPISLIITDQRMPEMTGVEFLEKTLATHPETVRILLTGYTDLESVITAVNKGQIFRYLTKPWDPVDLANTVDHAIERFVLGRELKQKNEELAKALEDLKSLDVAKSNFMILINHELKTPLTAILSFASLLKETVLSEEQRLFVDRINRSSEKLRSIIDDVLLIVRGDLGLIKPRVEKIKAESFFKNWNADVMASIKSKDQILDLEILTETIHCDPELTKVVLNRALHNATKFGLANSRIRVKCMARADGKNQFEVLNDGPHILEAMIEKVFKPFTLDENVMNHSVGMGLGLTICNSLVKAMQGEMQIINEVSGVRIRFSI